MLGPGAGNITDANGDLYWVGTIVFSAINATNTTFNILKLNKPDKYKSNAIFSILSGALQTTVGLVGTTDKKLYIPAAVNISVGLTTIVTSIIRLAKKSPPKENKVTFNLFYLPSVDHCTATVGFSVIGRIN